MTAAGAHVVEGLLQKSSQPCSLGAREMTYHARFGGPLLRLEKDGLVLAALCALFLDSR